ncbi:single-stranded-DNA-specific exonuclease RecJ [Bacillus gobiensis]|uniref:single-stranded-DNA-specific exonuclease RecJ n=1 Tax=Bacillus gobiensis TaxID=1441095 RepID=UPI003D1BA245
MLAAKNRWEAKKPDEQIVQSLMAQLDVSSLVAALLVNRGIETEDEARAFLYETNSYHDPFLLKGMDTSVERIKKAIDQKEKICVYGDYDADGVTSTTVILHTLKELGAEADFYIPDRFKEGYGPNEEAFRAIHALGCNLIITVDTGIAGVYEAEVAKELGMDLIITDHHEPGPELPNAFSIIHPNQPGCTYPFKDLAGVGVAFKLAHALLGRVPEHLTELAAIGTIADLVPLHGENRQLAKQGLSHIKHSSTPGIRALIRVAGTEQLEVDEETIGFQIAPRLNAVGRMEQADPAVHLLLSDNQEEAVEIATQINQLNKERQKLVAQMTDEAVSMVEQHWRDDHVIVVASENWNPGIAGIVASKLTERYYRPSIVLAIDEEKGTAKGSARSIRAFHLFNNLSQCRDILPHFGGHPMAAGMTLDQKDISELRDRLNTQAKDQLNDEDFIPVQEVDLICRIEELSLSNIEDIGKLAPFGMKNPKPLVVVEDANVEQLRKIGSNKNHLKMTIKEHGISLDCIGFFMGGLEENIVIGSKISVMGEISINEWNNSKKPQLMLKDAAVKEWQLFDLRGKKSWSELLKTIEKEKRRIICFNEETQMKFKGTELEEDTILIREKEDASLLGGQAFHIALIDMPPSLELFESVIATMNIERMYAIFHHSNDLFFTTFPTREHFKYYYALLLKRSTFDLTKHGPELAKHKGWTSESVEFMSQVFFDLGFVTIKNGLITIVNGVKKRDLTDSATYQTRKNEIELDQLLNYSTTEELKSWMDERMKVSSAAH